MVKKQKSAKGKSAKGAATTAAAQPVAALYRLDEGTERGDVVRAVLAEQGIRAKTVTADFLGASVGAIAGLPGLRAVRAPFTGEAPEDEFMLLANVSGAQLDALLVAMREAGCSVGCKAQVTQHNRLWPFAKLVSEVAREHALMSAGEA